MFKTKAGKILVALTAAGVLVAGSIIGTMAYLTSQASVTNTFTVGKVAITMDESKVDLDGTADQTADRVTANDYKLMPGHSYTKDPVIHVAAGSEDSYLFVKLSNGIKDLVDTTTIEDQIKEKGWNLLDGTTDVYYRFQPATTDAADVAVFENFKVKDDIDAETLEEYNGRTINVIGYAVQADGFDNAAAAWSATFGAASADSSTSQETAETTDAAAGN